MAGSNEEKLIYPIETVGADKAAEDVDKVAKALEKSAKAAKALAEAKIEAQRDSGLLKTAADYRAQADAVNNVGAALKHAADKSAGFSSAMKVANDNSINFREKAGALAATIGQMSTAFSGIAPEASAFNSIFGRMFATLGPLLGIIGTGGVGLAAGGLIAAVTGLGAAMSNSAKSGEELVDKLKEIAKLKGLNQQVADTKSYRTGQSDEEAQAEHYRQIRTQNEEKIRYLTNALANPAKLSYEEINNATVTLRAYEHQNAEIDRKIKGLEKIGRLQEEIRKKEDDYRAGLAADEAQQARDKKGLELTLQRLAAQGVRGTSIDFGQLQPPKERPKNQPRLTDSQQFLMDQAGVVADMTANELAKESDEELKRYQFNLREANAHANAVAQAGIDERNALREKETAFHIAQAEKKLAADKKAEEMRMELALKFAEAGAAVSARVLQLALAGQKIQLSGLLASIGNQMIAEGTMAVFSGAIREAFTYGTDGTGYIMMQNGAAEIAAGIAFSAAAGPTALTRAAGGTPTGGGVTSAGGSSPLRDNFGSQQAGPTTVYVTFTSPFAPSADDGMRIRQSLQMADWNHPRS